MTSPIRYHLIESEHQMLRRQKRRNVVLMMALYGFVAGSFVFSFMHIQSETKALSKPSLQEITVP